MLREILSIPTCYRHEGLLIEYIVKFGTDNGMTVNVDKKRNVYLTKGVISEGEFYPCVVAHTDTVHVDQKSLVEEDKRITIIELLVDEKRVLMGENPKNNKPTGIGGDDKCGVYIALKMMMEFDVIKGAFFVEEEIGMMGSKEADDEFFKDVGYAMQFDAPTKNWFSSKLMGIQLWNLPFLNVLKPVLETNDIDNITVNDPFTDVLQIRLKYNMCCAVFPTGYYRQHSSKEYVVPEETEKCLLLGIDAMRTLGKNKYTYR